jgi:hypothetical protein
MRSRIFVTLLFSGLMPLSAADLTGVDASLVRSAVQKSLPLLERVGPAFWAGSGCISCHNNSLPAMAISIAREHGFTVDEAAARTAMKTASDFLDARRDRLRQGIAPGGAQDTVSYILFGLIGERFPGDEATEAAARYLKVHQAEDGSYPIAARGRPPLEYSTFSQTALAIRTLQVFAPKSQEAEYKDSVRKGVAWLAQAEPIANEEYSFKVLGLAWGHAPQNVVAQSAATLVRQQRPDGGWSQLPALESDAYATGISLVALQQSGMKTTDPVYERGVEFLLRTQLPDGSWHVKTRSEASQIYFEAGYPHGVDQFISSAGGSWATAALALTQKP